MCPESSAEDTALATPDGAGKGSLVLAPPRHAVLEKLTRGFPQGEAPGGLYLAQGFPALPGHSPCPAGYLGQRFGFGSTRAKKRNCVTQSRLLSTALSWKQNPFRDFLATLWQATVARTAWLRTHGPWPAPESRWHHHAGEHQMPHLQAHSWPLAFQRDIPPPKEIRRGSGHLSTYAPSKGSQREGRR